MAHCSVCTVAPPKYRFPCCRARYCSVACFKAHDGTECRANGGRPEAVGAGGRPSPGPHAMRQCMEEPAGSIMAAGHPPGRPLGAGEPGAAATPAGADEDVEPILLSRAQLLKLKAYSRTRWEELLFSAKFREVLRYIDSRPTREARCSALEKQLERDRIFVEFVDEVVGAIQA